jgi:hypothetical protein
MNMNDFENMKRRFLREGIRNFAALKESVHDQWDPPVDPNQMPEVDEVDDTEGLDLEERVSALEKTTDDIFDILGKTARISQLQEKKSPL